MNKNFKLVVDMNVAFGNNAMNFSDYTKTEYWSKIEKQCKNIHDEYLELLEAIKNKNMIEIRDALCDIKVFAYGATHLMGVEFIPDNYTRFDSILGDWTKLENNCKTINELYNTLMLYISDQNIQKVSTLLTLIQESVNKIASELLLNISEDMQSVIDGVMTRFVKDEDDLKATIALHAAKGTTEVYTEGEYPKMILKSAKDQPDAPKGKFLKSASYKNTQFK